MPPRLFDVAHDRKCKGRRPVIEMDEEALAQSLSEQIRTAYQYVDPNPKKKAVAAQLFAIRNLVAQELDAIFAKIDGSKERTYSLQTFDDGEVRTKCSIETAGSPASREALAPERGPRENCVQCTARVTGVKLTSGTYPEKQAAVFASSSPHTGSEYEKELAGAEKAWVPGSTMTLTAETGAVKDGLDTRITKSSVQVTFEVSFGSTTCMHTWDTHPRAIG